MRDESPGPNDGRRSRQHWAVPAVALTVLALAGAACGTGGSGGSTTITLYNGQHEQTTAALVTAFEHQTGINVKVRSDSESVLVNQIQTEGSASPADVVYTENSLGLEQLQEQHLLAPIEPSTLAAVPARYSSPTGHWVGVSARVSTMIYNTGQLSPAQLPKSVMDLALPAWQRQGRARSGGGRLLPGRGIHRPSPRTGGGGGLVGGDQGQRRGQHLPGQRDSGQRSQPRAASRSGSSTATTGTASAPRSGLPPSTRPSPPLHRAIPATSSTCPAQGCCPRAGSRPPPSGSSPSWSAARDRRSWPTARASSTPSARV